MKRNRKYAFYSQQDGPELYRYFTEALIEGEMKMLKEEKRLDPLQTAFKKKETIVEKTMMGYLVNHVYCLACEFQTWTFDIFSDLILNIDEEKDRFYAQRIERLAEWRYGKKKKWSMDDGRDKWADQKDEAALKLDEKLEKDGKKCVKGFYQIDLKNFGNELIPNFEKNTDKLFTPDHIIPKVNEESNQISLEHLLEGFFKTNLLNNKDNYYTCEKCRKTVDMEKNIMFITSTYRLYDLPPCLAISLKRFRQTGTVSYFGGGGFTKINTPVSYPETLDLTPYVLSKTNFQRLSPFL